MNDVATTLKEAAYVTVGLGVLGLQKAQVRRVELTKQLESQVASAAEVAKELARDLDARVAPVRKQVEGRLDAWGDLLPAEAQSLFEQARAAAQETQAGIRQRLGLTSGA